MRAEEQSYLDACIGSAKPGHGDKRHFQMRQLGAEFWDGGREAKGGEARIGWVSGVALVAGGCTPAGWCWWCWFWYWCCAKDKSLTGRRSRLYWLVVMGVHT